MCNNFSNTNIMEKLSYNIERVKSSYNTIGKFDYLYKFSCSQLLENIDDVSSFSNYTHDEYKEFVIEQLTSEFKIALNNIIHGDPAGIEFIKEFKKSVIDKELLEKYYNDYYNYFSALDDAGFYEQILEKEEFFNKFKTYNDLIEFNVFKGYFEHEKEAIKHYIRRWKI